MISSIYPKKVILLMIKVVQVVDAPNLDCCGIPDCTQVAEDENGIQVPKDVKEK